MTRFKLKSKNIPLVRTASQDNIVTCQCKNIHDKSRLFKTSRSKVKEKKRGRGSEETSAYIMSLLVSSVVLLTLEVF